MEAYVEEAETYEKCIEKINSQYGPNIRVTRQEIQKRKSFFGLFEKNIIRLTFNIKNTTYDIENTPDKNLKSFTISEKPINIQTKKVSNFVPPSEEESRREILEEASKSEKLKEKIEPYINTLNTKTENRKEFDALTESSNKQVKILAKKVEELVAKIESSTINVWENKNIEKISEILEENDFSKKYIKKIKTKIRENLNISELEDFDSLQKRVIQWIADSIETKSTDFSLKTGGKIISLVGPTGVGKTTTISKLAAYNVFEGSNKAERLLTVQMITIDGYRIGAISQIKKYCEHMKIPLAVAENPADLRKYLELYKNTTDVICIDTTGRSPTDYAKILEMQSYFEVIDKNLAETHLVLSAVSKSNDMKEIIKQYKGFSYQSLIITKLDETTNIGNIISVLDEFEIPVAFVTTGQRVPKDLQVACKKLFLKRLKGFNIEVSFFDEEFNDEISISWERKFW